MITCVSERSGIASKGIFFSDHTAAAMAAKTKVRTINLLRAENSMIFSTSPSRGLLFSMLMPPFRSGHPFQRGLKTALRIDQKITAGNDNLSFLNAAFQLIITIGLGSYCNVSWLKNSLPLVNESDLFRPGIENSSLRDAQCFPQINVKGHIHIHIDRKS